MANKHVVWSVQFDGEPFDLWIDEGHAIEAAAASVYGRMDECDQETVADMPDSEVVKWWNDNREPKVSIKEHIVLSTKMD